VALNHELRDLFVEAINEYLDIAELCIERRKPEGGCFGYPATLLLFCTIDAMGRNLVREEKRKLKHKDVDFGMLTHPSFGLNLDRNQLEKLGEWYRHKLAHLALISRGAILRGEDNDSPFSFASNGEPNTIHILPLFKIIKAASNRMDKNLFEPSARLGGPMIPANVLDTELSSAVSGVVAIHTGLKG